MQLAGCVGRGVRGRGVAAFSMPELLTVVAVMGILVSLATAALNPALASASRVREMDAGRRLVAAYLMAANDTGSFLPGYDRMTGEIVWPDGTLASGPIAHRYPYRLGPYIDYKLEGTLLVNENARQVNSDDAYSVSLSPAFGINYLFVGGERMADGTSSLPGEVASRLANGANLLVFATAARREGGEVTHGFNLLTPPRIYSSMWVGEKWNCGANPGNYGHLHARHGDKAVCGFLDGSIRLLAIEEMRDMRLWSMRAAEAGDPDYVVTPAAPPPGSGRR
jgi:prepilin-type N-terminal cleavage/methylation domain-containing protein